MKTMREVWVLSRGMTQEELAAELGTTVEWVRSMMDTDAWEYLEGNDAV